MLIAIFLLGVALSAARQAFIEHDGPSAAGLFLLAIAFAGLAQFVWTKVHP